MENKFIATLILMVLALDCLCQEREEKYPSQQEKNYNKKNQYKEFEPEAISIIKSVKYDHISLRSQDTNNKFIAVWERTNYFKYYDSLEDICRTNLWKVIGTPKERKNDWDPVRYFKYYDSLTKLGVVVPDLRDDPKYKEADKKCDKCTDSVRKLIHHYKIADINSELILRYDSLNSKKILFYVNPEFEGEGLGYWVALSDDNGKSWSKYYTGLVPNWFYYVKPNSKISLIKHDSTIQLEIAIVREIEPGVHPTPPKYELVEDNLVMELNLRKLVSDKDHDGLTDILERKLFTNPFSKDTDHDGIDDGEDSNPRFKSVKNKYSSLFKFLLEHGAMKDSVFVSFDNFEFKARADAGLRRETHFIITDNSNLSSLIETKDKYIFLTSRELVNYAKRNYGPIKQLYVSPLFDIDAGPRYRKISIGGSFWRTEYLVIEKANGWIVKIVMWSIS